MGMALYRVLPHPWLSCSLQQLKGWFQALDARGADQLKIAECVLNDAGGGCDLQRTAIFR